MDDDEYLAQFTNVTDPAEALRVIANNANFLGGDPYYADIVDALIALADRLGATETPNVRER